VIRFAVPGNILPWARAGGRGVRRYTREPQRKYMAVIRDLAAEAMAGRPLIAGPIELKVMATWPWPKSRTKRELASPTAGLKATRPDLDNVTKIVKDSLNLVVWRDDAQVTDLHARKRYGGRAGLSVEVRALG